MRSPGIRLHKLALFGWAVVVTAVLLLLSLPVLAGEIIIASAINLAICLELWIFTQSAGNLFNYNYLIILRDYTLEFISCKLGVYIYFIYDTNSKSFMTCSLTPSIWGREKKMYSKENIKFLYTKSTSNNKNFAKYFTGLVEGDGSIFVPKSERSLKEILNYPSLQISFHSKDIPLALLIQKEIKHGSISKKKGVNAYVYTINNYNGLITVISLLNGNMRTNKIHSLYRLIDFYNKYKETNIEKLKINHDPLNLDAWLSGFIESDGHFQVRTTVSKKYTKLECKFELVQREKDHNGYDNIANMENIAKLLGCLVKKIRTNTKNPQYRIRTTNLNSNLYLSHYLEAFPLFGSKSLDFNDWSKIVSLYKNGRLNHKANLEFAKKIKSQMNDKRTNFVWDGLNKFYNINE